MHRPLVKMQLNLVTNQNGQTIGSVKSPKPTADSEFAPLCGRYRHRASIGFLFMPKAAASRAMKEGKAGRGGADITIRSIPPANTKGRWGQASWRPAPCWWSTMQARADQPIMVYRA